MGFAVALDLGRLVKQLPTRTLHSIFAIDRLAGERLDDWEHATVGKIAVVGDGEQVAAGLVLIGRHPLPQVARVVAAERLHGRERLDEACSFGSVSEDDVAMQIVAARIRRPLIAYECREPARIIGLFGSLDRLLPG